MAEPLRLFIVAGEPSGDRIAADLVAQLRSRTAITISGIGGDELIGQGLVSLFPMTDLAVMGVTDVLLRLPLLFWRVEQTARAIVRDQPDIVVLVDAQDFSKLVAQRARRLGYTRAIILYVAPSVWARSPGRAAKLRPLVDEVLAVLPFEPKVMHELGGPPTYYVGHPALAEVSDPHPALDAGLVALLPGSREGELRRHLPFMRALAEGLASHMAVTGFYIPTLPGLAHRLEREVSTWSVSVEVFPSRNSRPTLYQQTLCAICVSGTATLELALAGVPMLLTYVMDAPQAAIYERHGRPLVGLPNIVAGRKFIPEFIAREPDIAALTEAATILAENKQARQDQLKVFGELVELMRNGTVEAPRQNPADRILAHRRV